MTSVEIAWKEEKKPQMPNDDDARHLMMGETHLVLLDI